jgi:hypothetical protein
LTVHTSRRALEQVSFWFYRVDHCVMWFYIGYMPFYALMYFTMSHLNASLLTYFLFYRSLPSSSPPAVLSVTVVSKPPPRSVPSWVLSRRISNYFFFFSCLIN